MNNNWYQNFLKLLADGLAKYQTPVPTPIPSTQSSERLYSVANACLGIDASPNDLVPDEVGCAETVSDIINKAFPSDMPVIVSTSLLYTYLKNSPKWIQVDQPRRGDVIISPSGYGNGRLSNGHTGYLGNGVGDQASIMSNNSNTGLFDIHYTLATWNARYKAIGGYPVLFFRRT